MLTYENKLLKLAYWSIWTIALFSYSSVSASALSHIFIIIPGFYFLYKAFKENQLNLSKSNIAMIALIIFGIISVIAADDIENKFKVAFKLKYFILPLLAIFPYRLILKNIKSSQIRLIFNVFFMVLTIGNIAGIHALFSGYHLIKMKAAADETRAAGMYGMAITYGYGIEFIVIILTSLIFNYKQSLSEYFNKKLFYAALVSSYLGLYFSFTRGALLALIVSFPFIFIKTKKKLFISLSVIGILIVGILTYLVFYGSSSNRFLMKAKSDPNMIRLSQYQSAYKGFLEKPLTGLGYRNFESNVERLKNKYDLPFKNFAGHAHNNYLEFLADTGIFGFISFVLFIFFWIYDCFKRNDILAITVFPFLVSFSFSGLFQNTITDAENMFFIMFIYSIFYATQNIQSKKNSL